MTLKIIGGKFKGRKLTAPKTATTRPTQGMLREAVFNICQNLIEEARFLDLFAGSGAMGLEALSRGASHATLVESNRQAISCIRLNIADLQLDLQTTLIPLPANRALSLLNKQGEKFNLVYLDPPYNLNAESLILSLIKNELLQPNAIVFLEERYDPKIQAKPLAFPSLILKDSRRFGIALLHQFLFSDR